MADQGRMGNVPRAHHPIHGELCGQRALGCGPCQLVDGHDGPHLCDHYAKGGVELHDEDVRNCHCPDCERERLTHRVNHTEDQMVRARSAHESALRALQRHTETFG